MKPPSPSRQGFTLVEILVSVTILSLMLVMMANIIGLVEQSWRQAQNRIDNFTKARSMLDLISGDLQRAVFRGDLPIFLTGTTASTPAVTSDGVYYYTSGSFAAAFYTRLPGAMSGTSGSSSPVRGVSLVSYALISGSSAGEDMIVLQRSDLSVPWTSGTANNLSFQGNIASLLANASPSEVAPGVVGFRLAFRRADGTIYDQSAYTGYNSSNPVVAVNVGLAVISQKTLTQLASSQITQIQNAFASGTMSNGIKTTWDQQVLTSSFYTPYPRSLGEDLKTFECWVGCPPF